MTDLTVWEVSPVNTVIDHVISRYHNTHRAQLEELVPLAHKIASTSPDGFPAELPELLEYIQNELLMHMMKEERMLFPMAKQGLGSRAAMPVNVSRLTSVVIIGSDIAGCDLAPRNTNIAKLQPR